MHPPPLTETAQAVLDALFEAGPILRALEPAQPLDDPSYPASARALLHAMAAGIGLTVPRPGPVATPSSGGDALLRLLHRALARMLDAVVELERQGLDARELERRLPEWRARTFEARFVRSELAGRDGSPLRAYASQPGPARVVVLASACGMPATLCRPWLEALAGELRVLTWTSRGLFDARAGFDERAARVDDHVDDLLSVLDHHGVASAHVMGLCGGAVIAAAAAAAAPDRVHSLSLWHGDYELGEQAPRTEHQRNLVALLELARRDRDQAARLLSLLRSSGLDTVRPEDAPTLLYPYANAELFYRYACLNGAIMTTNVRPLLPRIRQPVLVVTSADDVTAHPEGSRQVAAGLRNARLHEAPQGDHLSLFAAPPSEVALAHSYLASLPWP